MGDSRVRPKVTAPKVLGGPKFAIEFVKEGIAEFLPYLHTKSWGKIFTQTTPGLPVICNKLVSTFFYFASFPRYWHLFT